MSNIQIKHEGPYMRRRRRPPAIRIILVAIALIAVAIFILAPSGRKITVCEKAATAPVVVEEVAADVISRSAGPKTAPVSAYPLTLEERDLVERIVATEARGVSQRGKDAVAQTILDRKTLWGGSVTDICVASGQYADPYEGTISEEVKQAVVNVFDYGFRVYEEPTFKVHDDSVHPYWADQCVFRGQIDNLLFYGERIKNAN